MNKTEQFKHKIAKTANEDYDDATVKSNQEAAKAFSPLALRLADEIKSLPKFCNREDIARIIEPHLRNL